MPNGERTSPSPSGECWCGCGEPTSRKAFFTSSHDRKAESMLIRMHFGTIAGLLAAHAYGPGRRNLREEFERWAPTSNA
jgi:hypothetical protein